jgi:PmbA protein
MLKLAVNSFKFMFAKNIYKKFDTAKKKKIISDYRVSVLEAKSFSSGITNKEIAGVYNPNNFASQISGNCLVQWQDKMISLNSFNNEILYSFDEFLKDIRTMKYKDSAAANFLSKQKYSNVKLYDKNVADIVQGKENTLLDLMLKLDKFQQNTKAKLKEISVFADVSKNTIFTSKGLFGEEQTTSCGYSSVYDNTIALEDNLRKIPANQEVNKKRAFVENFYLHLVKDKKVKPKDKKIPVILMPWVSKQVFSHFIISNLNGASVFSKQSCFSVNDFKNKKQALRKDINLTCNPVIDFDIGSYKFTGEGVPSRKINFIKNGKLENQILDLKYAKLQKTKPTGILSKPILNSEKKISFESCLKSIDEGIMIFDILGLHTQSPVSGDYSLPCPNALYIKKGRIIGRARPIIVGNFFQDINQDDLEIIDFPLEDFPGLLIKPFASFEEAQ